MNTNSQNPKVGKAFQEMVCKTLREYFQTDFDSEVAIPIGNPSKEHKFDAVSKDKKIVAECKCYTWTDTGNVPSAKLMGLNEALFYMSFLPKDTTKILCMKKDEHSKREETLAEYYVRIDGHLLRDAQVFEVDEKGEIKIVN